MCVECLRQLSAKVRPEINVVLARGNQPNANNVCPAKTLGHPGRWGKVASTWTTGPRSTPSKPSVSPLHSSTFDKCIPRKCILPFHSLVAQSIGPTRRTIVADHVGRYACRAHTCTFQQSVCGCVAQKVLDYTTTVYYFHSGYRPVPMARGLFRGKVSRRMAKR